MYLFEYDLAVLNDMQDQVKEASGSAKKDGKTMMERVKQNRGKPPTGDITDGDVVELLKQQNIPVEIKKG